MLFKTMFLFLGFACTSYADTINELEGASPHEPARSKFVMSFDGGGIRGVFSLTLLNEIETRLSSPLTDYVNLFAGTSTGGIIALSLASGKNANEILSIYKNEGDKVFYRSSWHKLRSVFGLIDEKYEVSKFEPLLKNYYGINVHGNYNTLADLSLADAMVVATDITDNKVKIFSSIAAKKDSTENYPLWLSARATSAAPTYFEPVEIDGHAIVDGGLSANNPTELAVREIRKEYGKRAIADLKTVSIGTGVHSSGLTFDTAKDMGVLEWASPISGTIMSTGLNTVHTNMRQDYDHFHYKRLDVMLEKNITLDDASAENIQYLENVGLAYIQSHPHKIDQVVKMFEYNGRK